jgi:ribonucleoside-triphosphate reductase
LPSGFTDDLFEALEMQEPLQSKYTGGTVFHSFLNERADDPARVAALVRRIAENYTIPYFTVTPGFSVCPVRGYVPDASCRQQPQNKAEKPSPAALEFIGA